MKALQGLTCWFICVLVKLSVGVGRVRLQISKVLNHFGKQHDWKQMVKMPMKQKVSYLMSWVWFRCQFCLISLWDFCLPRGDNIYLWLCLVNYWHLSLLICFSWWGVILYFEWYHPVILCFTLSHIGRIGEGKERVSIYQQLLNKLHQEEKTTTTTTTTKNPK